MNMHNKLPLDQQKKKKSKKIGVLGAFGIDKHLYDVRVSFVLKLTRKAKQML